MHGRRRASGAVGEDQKVTGPASEDGLFLSASLPPAWKHLPCLDLKAETGFLVTDHCRLLAPVVPVQTLCSVKNCLDEGTNQPGHLS